MDSSVTHQYRFADVVIDAQSFRLLQAGQRLAIEPKALHVLIFLVQNQGRLVERRELLSTIWGDAFVTDHVLNRAVGQLRKVLTDDPKQPRYIETVPTLGYRFIAAVETATNGIIGPLPEHGANSPDESVESSPAGLPQANRLPLSLLEPARPLGPGATLPKWLLLAAILVLATIPAAWLSYRYLRANAPIHSLAVLPLVDLSPGAREDYFADGMTDELITELAHIPDLRVVSRTSVMQDKGARKPLSQIAREFDVDAVIEGSVLRSGDRIRIIAQLIDTRSDKHLWAQTFEEPVGDILSLQDDVAKQIARQTTSVLTPAAQAGLANAKYVNPKAHDDYLRGLFFIQRREGDLAASYFRKSIALAPDYASAQAGLAEALVTQVLADGEHASAIMPSAIAAAKRAIELDPYSGQAYTVLGAIDTIYLYEWPEAEQNLRKGLELSPGSSDAEIWYAIYLTSVGRPSEAVSAMQRAVAHDPFSFWANRLLGSMLYYARRYDESLDALNRASEIAPDKGEFVQGWYSSIYELQGRYEEAFAADLVDMASEITPKDVELFRSAFKTGGWKAYQEARVQFLLPRSMSECHMNPVAMSYVRLGNLDETFHWLNRDMDNHCGRTIFDLSADPRLDTIRHDPRFAVLRSRAKLPH
jgi:TolB-like protein/DNA-binding winged helix-turn-helix (wHTH) protein